MDISKYNTICSLYSRAATITAITDLRFSVLWTNNAEFFSIGDNILDMTHDIQDFPIRRERSFRLYKSGILRAATAKPLYSGFDVEGYVCEIFDTNNVISLLGKSDVFDTIQPVIANFREGVNNLLSATDILSDKMMTKDLIENVPVVESQRRNCYKLYTSLNNITEFFDNTFVMRQVSAIKVRDYLEAVIIQCNTILAKCGRFIDYYLENTKAAICVSDKKLLISLVNAIQNALIYSNENSKITLNMKIEGKYAVITIENDGNIIPEEIFALSGDPNVNGRANSRPGLGLFIIKQFTENADGNFSIKPRENGGAILRMEIPLADEDIVAAMLNAPADTAYLTDGYSPINMYLNEYLLSRL